MVFVAARRRISQKADASRGEWASVWCTVAAWRPTRRKWNAVEPRTQPSDESAIRGHRLQRRHVVEVSRRAPRPSPVIYQRRRAGGVDAQTKEYCPLAHATTFVGRVGARVLE